MATSSQNMTFNGTTITSGELQALWQFFAAGMLAGGWVKLTETGEVNTGTVTLPGSNGVSSGFQIWRMNDSLHATHPCFVKFEIYRDASASQLGLGITIGTGSDGSGTITGVRQSLILTSTAVGGTLAVGAIASLPMYMSVDTDRMLIGNRFTSNVNSGGYFCIERTSDENGDITDLGVNLFWGRVTTMRSQLVKWTGTNPAAETVGQCLAPVGQTSGLSEDNDTTLFPFFMWDIGQPAFPLRSFIGAYTTDVVSAGSTQTINLYGNNHTYMTIENTRLSLSRGTVTGFATLMRYD
jgi:hypothetical protein